MAATRLSCFEGSEAWIPQAYAGGVAWTCFLLSLSCIASFRLCLLSSYLRDLAAMRCDPGGWIKVADQTAGRYSEIRGGPAEKSRGTEKRNQVGGAQVLD